MKKIVLFLISVSLILGAIGCGTQSPSESTSINTVQSEPNDSTTDVATNDDTPVKIAVLNGTTGFGIAPLYSRIVSGEIKNYTIDFYADATLIPPQLINKSVDIAAVPTNLASTLFKKTEGGVQVLCVNTLGVLYLIENGNTVSSINDLIGKTVFVPGQGSNPEYVLRSLLTFAGIIDKVTIDYSYGTPDELTSALASGKASLGVIPEPKVSAALTKNTNLRSAIDFSKEWKDLTGVELVQGCLVIRKEFAVNHPETVKNFLANYEASVNVVKDDPDTASKAIVSAGIAASESLVKNALPRCNIVYLTGSEMESSLNKFWKSLFDIIPSSIGGSVPTDEIFYHG